jgi:CPA2 family monovalent cation:H+ antiporter-2
LRVIAHVRSLRPDIPIVVRAAEDNDVARLTSAGATEVVPEALESSLMLASHTLLLTGVPVSRVVRRVGAVRESRYGLLRGFFHGSSDEAEDLTERQHIRLHSVVLDAGAAAVGKTLGEMNIVDHTLEIIAVRRPGQASPRVAPDLVFESGDVVVLKGTPEPISEAERQLLGG